MLAQYDKACDSDGYNGAVDDDDASDDDDADDNDDDADDDDEMMTLKIMMQTMTVPMTMS